MPTDSQREHTAAVLLQQWHHRALLLDVDTGVERVYAPSL
jgi:hypothetical protein